MSLIGHHFLQYHTVYCHTNSPPCLYHASLMVLPYQASLTGLHRKRYRIKTRPVPLPLSHPHGATCAMIKTVDWLLLFSQAPCHLPDIISIIIISSSSYTLST